ncbi:MAG: hypothetical protein K2M43_02205, partial [Mycoplasmoidaceae bacterium]|nr:hypothetical protein [Mycoplasmoidaceae bacterium]
NNISEIKGYASSIENSIPYNGNYESIMSQINNGVDDQGKELKTPDDYRKVLLKAFDQTVENPIITDVMFKPFNFKK